MHDKIYVKCVIFGFAEPKTKIKQVVVEPPAGQHTKGVIIQNMRLVLRIEMIQID